MPRSLVTSPSGGVRALRNEPPMAWESAVVHQGHRVVFGLTESSTEHEATGPSPDASKERRGCITVRHETEREADEVCDVWRPGERYRARGTGFQVEGVAQSGRGRAEGAERKIEFRRSRAIRRSMSESWTSSEHRSVRPGQQREGRRGRSQVRKMENTRRQQGRSGGDEESESSPSQSSNSSGGARTGVSDSKKKAEAEPGRRREGA